MVKRQRGFTVVELLVTLAIMVLLFALLFKPLRSALEIVDTGRQMKAVTETCRATLDQLTREIAQAIWVRPSVYFHPADPDLVKVPQWDRLDLLLPAQGPTGLLDPLTPARGASRTNQTGFVMVTYYRRLRNPWLVDDGTDLGQPDYTGTSGFPYVGYNDLSDPDRRDQPFNPYVLYRAEYVAQRVDGTVGPDPDSLWANDPGLAAANYPWAWLRDGPVPGSSGAAARPILPHIDPTGGDPLDDAFSNGQMAVTDRNANVAALSFTPALIEDDFLKPNGDYTAYLARHGLWVRPFQFWNSNDPTDPRNGSWVNAAASLDPSGAMGGVIRIEMFSERRMSPPLEVRGDTDLPTNTSLNYPLPKCYFISVHPDPLVSDPKGRPLIFRDADDDGQFTSNDWTRPWVYDTTQYPARTLNPNLNPGNGEFACGIDWERGRLLFDFPRRDVLDTSLLDTTGKRLLDGTNTRFYLTIFDDVRLQNRNLTFPDMSVVPGSETVTVCHFPGTSNEVSRTYRRSDSSMIAGVSGNPDRYEYFVNYADGLIQFNGSQGDGWNPPGPWASSDNVRIIIQYSYRNNLPTVHEIGVSRRDRTPIERRESIRATYLTRSEINIEMQITLPDVNDKKAARQRIRLKAKAQVQNGPRPEDV